MNSSRSPLQALAKAVTVEHSASEQKRFFFFGVSPLFECTAERDIVGCLRLFFQGWEVLADLVRRAKERDMVRRYPRRLYPDLAVLSHGRCDRYIARCGRDAVEMRARCSRD